MGQGSPGVRRGGRAVIAAAVITAWARTLLNQRLRERDLSHAWRANEGEDGGNQPTCQGDLHATDRRTWVVGRHLGSASEQSDHEYAQDNAERVWDAITLRYACIILKQEAIVLR